jgi:GT2 family glycosyltransferase
LRRAGWKLYFVPAARIVHHLGASSERDWQTRARMVGALNWSRHYYYSRHEGAAHGALLKWVFVCGAALRLLTWSFVALLRRGAHEKVSCFVVFCARRGGFEVRQGLLMSRLPRHIKRYCARYTVTSFHLIRCDVKLLLIT